MKRILIILTLVMLLKPILPVIEYLVNYDYISKVLCVNKAKPKLQCNGKCHLTKELAKASENEKPLSTDRKIALLDSETLFFEEIRTFQMSPLYLAKKENIKSDYINLYHYLSNATAFHPPIPFS